MTMVTAMAMYEELLKYDNVDVYLTHTEDVNLSLADRAQLLKSGMRIFIQYSLQCIRGS